MKKILLFALMIFCLGAQATTWKIGPKRAFTVPSQVAKLVADGDTVVIDSGSYRDSAMWTKNRLVLEGAGAYAHLHDAVYGRKGIWVITGDSTMIRNIEFSGAAVDSASGENGAGIRAFGGSFTVRHCYFHNNQEGILENPGSTVSNILIENSVFEHNGVQGAYAAGYEHNMYIGNATSLRVQFCYVHGSVIGHNIKSRARRNYILYNSIMDRTEGTSSMDIDLPNGGQAIVLGNLIEKGPNAINHKALSFGEEGMINPGPQSLFIAYNTFVNDINGAMHFISLPPKKMDTLFVGNNIFAGSDSVLLFNGAMPGQLDTSANLVTATIAAAGLKDPANYDYALKPSSPARGNGNILSSAEGFSLQPYFEYVDSANGRGRPSMSMKDIGALGYRSLSDIEASANPQDVLSLSVAGNGSPEVHLRISGLRSGQRADVSVFDMAGRKLLSAGGLNNESILEAGKLPAGMYIAHASDGERMALKKFVVGM